jgi:hypothetical protein
MGKSLVGRRKWVEDKALSPPTNQRPTRSKVLGDVMKGRDTVTKTISKSQQKSISSEDSLVEGLDASNGSKGEVVLMRVEDMLVESQKWILDYQLLCHGIDSSKVEFPCQQSQHMANIHLLPPSPPQVCNNVFLEILGGGYGRLCLRFTCSLD